MSTTASPGLDAFGALVDDAAVFPPENAPVPDAVGAHAAHRAAWYSALVGGFVCSDTRLTELQAALEDADDPPVPLGVTLTISGGAGAVGPALTWVERDDRLRLTGLEVALRDEDDLAHNAARMTTVLRDVPDDVTAYVEMPRLHGAGTPMGIPAGWSAALDEVAAAGLRVKFRTGGLDHDAFPTAAELAVVIAASLDRETPFKCTAGLHHAVRHIDERTGFEHHGFLNVLLATRTLFDGGSGADAEKLLEQRDPADVGEQVRVLGTAAVRSTRRWFTSLGSCSVLEPVDDLVDLGLISKG
ncbi:MAG TPA: hypothetical protein VNP20_18195 [Nocardioidaceae bacterium]|nr:hypothetical protein [Nocardioidaceae bacterium]